MSTPKNIIKNGIAYIFQKFVKVIEQLLLVPFFISAWGAEFYGEWLTLTIIPSVIYLANFGFGSAAGNSFVLNYVAGNKKIAGDIEKTGFIIISFAVLLGVFLTIATLLFITKIGWLSNLSIPVNTSIKALILMMAAKLLSFYYQFFDAHFRAAQKAALGINLVAVNSLLLVVVGFIVLILGGGIVSFALSQFLVSICFVVFFGWKAVTILKVKTDDKKFEKAIAKDIIKTGIGYLTFPAWQAIFFQGTTFVVRLTLGPVAVAVFNTVRTLSNSVAQIIEIVKNSIFPELQFELGKGNLGKAQNLYVKAIRISVLFSFVLIVILAFWGLPLYNIWTQNALTPPMAMWYVFLLALLIKSAWWVTEIVYLSLNKPYRLGISALIVSIISVICSYFLCKLYGLTGAALGTLVFEIIMALYILPTSCKLMTMPIGKFLQWKN